MTTASEEILARYRQTEMEMDTFGRPITVPRLRPSKEMAVLRMGDSDDQGVRTVLMVVAAVQKIGEDLITFPKSLGELNSIMDRLDQEGITAATKAYMRLMAGPSDPDAKPEDTVEQIKN